MRFTTDTPQNNLEQAMNLFYVEDGQTWVRGYGKDGADINLFDLARKLMGEFTESSVSPETMSDDNVSFVMMEWLFDGTDSIEGVLALLYQAAWVCSELRERLKGHEDEAEKQ